MACKLYLVFLHDLEYLLRGELVEKKWISRNGAFILPKLGNRRITSEVPF